MSLLADILDKKREEIQALLASPPRRASLSPVPVRLRLDCRLSLIAEIKRRSPSAGALSTKLTVEERARAYATNGAAMISVLCDATYFDGGFDHVARARRALDAAGARTPILAKEFVLDPVQIACAAEAGASAILLIVRIVDDATLAHLISAASAHGLCALVEVATEDELQRAVGAGATHIGVNARDLDTLAMDRGRAERVLASVPPEISALHLSGVKAASDVRSLTQSRADGALIGETLMREDDPGPLLSALYAAASRGGS